MNEIDDYYAKTAWESYQSSIGTDYRDALNKAFNDTIMDQFSVLPDTGNPNLEQANKEYELDKLFGVTPTLGPAISRASITGNTIMGKSATHVWLDDPWDLS